MGQCQCRSTGTLPVHFVGDNLFQSKGGTRRGKLRARKGDDLETPAKKNEVGTTTEVRHDGANRVDTSPSEATVPETPDTIMSHALSMPLDSIQEPVDSNDTPKRSNAKKSKFDCINHRNEEDMYKSPMEFASPPSLLRLEQLEAVIPEEVDPDAPSDEEEHFKKTESSKKNTVADEGEPGRLLPGSNRERKQRSLSPSRPLSMVKIRNYRDPNSIVRRPPPEEAEALFKTRQSAIDAHTMAEFKKLKLQAKLAAYQRRLSGKRAKLEDRFQDVRDYRELWKRFEEIEKVVGETEQSSSSPRKRKRRGRLFDLHNPASWFFDFEELFSDEEDDGEDEEDNDDDDQSLASQGSRMSLLSAASMDSQRRYYAEKRRLREQKEKGVLTEKTNLQATLDAMEAMLQKQSLTNNKDAGISNDTDKSGSARRKIRQLLCAPRSITFNPYSKTALHKNRNEEEPKAGIQSIACMLLDESPTKLRDSPDNVTVKGKPSFTGREQGNHMQGAPHDESDSPTEAENDYRVSRRRRLPYDPNAEEASDIAAIWTNSGPSCPTKSPDPGSLPQDTLALELPPSSDVANSPRWRTFSATSTTGTTDGVLTSNAAKCLENVYAAMEKEEEGSAKSTPERSSPSKSPKQSPPKFLSAFMRRKSKSPETSPRQQPVFIPVSPKHSPTKSPRTPKHYVTPTKSPRTPTHNGAKKVSPNTVKQMQKHIKPELSIHTMSTEQFLTMSVAPLGTESLDGGLVNDDCESSGQEVSLHDGDQDDTPNVVLHGVADLLSQVRTDSTEVNITTSSIATLSDISNAPDDEEEFC